MCSNYPGIKLEPALQRWDKIEHLSSYADVVHSTAKQVISRRRKNENVCEMPKNEKCTCRACKTTVFHCQICKFVTFLLPLSWWLLKLLMKDITIYPLVRRRPWADLPQARNETKICLRWQRDYKIKFCALLNISLLSLEFTLCKIDEWFHNWNACF